jgi:geranylgeranylglycerol-phosphate geranylgeranyltransferase
MLVGLLRLLRLSNSLPASLLVLLGARLADAPLLNSRLWLAVGAMWAIAAFGYVSNDLSDQLEDRINKPDRPLPTGVITSRQARIIAALLCTLALLFSSRLGLAPFLVALLVLGLLTLYNRRLKGVAGVGNLLIAGLAAGALLPGVVAVYGWQWLRMIELLPAVLGLFFFILARELLKTLEDMTGDLAVDKRTFALTWGSQGTLYSISGLTVLLFGTVIVLFPWWCYSWLTTTLMLFGVVLPLAWSIYTLTPPIPLTQIRQSLALLKGAYFVGLVALWLA